jgi:Transposase
VDPGDRSRVNESPQPARLGRGPHHETHQAHSRADHPQAQDRRATDRWGKTVADVCRVIEVTQPTYHRWRQQFGGMQAEEARRLTQLEQENARLKKLLAEAELEKAMLKDLVAP